MYKNRTEIEVTLDDTGQRNPNSWSYGDTIACLNTAHLEIKNAFLVRSHNNIDNYYISIAYCIGLAQRNQSNRVKQPVNG